jgi:radical SAM superfamily enzyme YgiQ (UPF0313 family)
MAVKILFAFYPLYVSYNYGIALLSSLCKSFGIETAVYLLDDVEKFKEYLGQNDFQYVGFSCVTKHDYLLSLPFMQAASSEDRVTLLGGVFPRLGHPLYAPVTAACRGEGEMLPMFLANGYTGLFQQQERYPDLNELPLPDYELFRDIPYDRDLPYGCEGVMLPYSSSRGCPYHCKFCAISLQPPGVRIRTKVGEDLELLTEIYKPDIVHFLDELIPYYDPAWRESWGDFKHPFVAYIRADILPEHLVWLRDKGMQGCFFGIETGNEQFRNQVLGKDLSDRQIRNTVSLLKEMGMPYMVSYIRGLPGETWEIQAETMEFYRELGGYPVICLYEDMMGA